MASRRLERGQATTDYIALLAVVVALVAVGATLTGVGAPGVVNAVRAQIAHALCIVTGRACHAERSLPCTVAMRRESRRFGLNLAFIRLDKNRLVIREQLSDRTVRLTLINRFGAGAEGGLGANVQVDQNLNSGGVGREVKFGAGGLYGTGKIFRARNAREADAIVRALERGDRTPVGPRESVYEVGIKATGSLKLGPSLNAQSTRIVGLRRDLKTGATTVTLNIGDSASALLESVVGGPTGSADTNALLALKLDRRRRPLELSLLASGTIAAGAKFSKALATPLALSDSDAVPANIGGRRWEFGARVDLTDPQVATAWKRFRGSPASPAAIRGLGQALRDRAHLDLRTYRARNSSNGTALGLALFAKFGVETERSIDRFNLLAASSRPPGGLWEPRLDCVR